jgi:hypothetical protein
MNITRAIPADFFEIELQPRQTAERAKADPAFAEVLAAHLAYTARIDGRIIAIAGIIPLDRDVGEVWCGFAVDAGRYFTRLARTALRLFEVCGKSRLLAVTACDFGEGCRLLELLGFKREEDPLKGSAPGEPDKWIYVRVST